MTCDKFALPLLSWIGFELGLPFFSFTARRAASDLMLFFHRFDCPFSYFAPPPNMKPIAVRRKWEWEMGLGWQARARTRTLIRQRRIFEVVKFFTVALLFFGLRRLPHLIWQPQRPSVDCISRSGGQEDEWEDWWQCWAPCWLALHLPPSLFPSSVTPWFFNSFGPCFEQWSELFNFNAGYVFF